VRHTTLEWYFGGANVDVNLKKVSVASVLDPIRNQSRIQVFGFYRRRYGRYEYHTGGYVANQLGLPCAAISVITDECDPDNLKPVNIPEIMEVAGWLMPN
jgi:hypothetical protein